MRAILLLSGLLAGALGAPTLHDRAGHVLHQKRSEEVHYNAWVKREAADPNTKVQARVALKQRNLERGMDLIMEVSDPKHASGKYGQWYSREQLIELFAPADESIVKVKEWLVLSGVAEASIVVPQSKGWVHFDATVSQLEALVKADYHIYNHARSPDEGSHLGTDEYHLPADIAAHVDFIVPGTAFAQLHRRGRPSSLRKRKLGPGQMGGARPFEPLEAEAESNPGIHYSGDCARSVTPNCLRSMYNIPSGSKAHPSNKLGIFEEDQEYYVQSDMDKYVKLVAPWVPLNFTPVAGGECMLDFEMAVPLIYPQQTVLYSVPSPPGNTQYGIWNPFLDAMDGSYCNFTSHGYTGDTPSIDGTWNPHECGTVAATNVISISYGLTEPFYPGGKYLERQCDEWMKLALGGTTVLVASGDDGVGGSGIDCQGPNHDIFVPDATCDCPYITGVGSTALPLHKRPGDREIATEGFSSGGGFSNVYKTPDFQKDAVQTYLTKYPPKYPSFATSRGQVPKTGGVYNRIGRGFPDLSAVGSHGFVVVGGQSGHLGGTSMSAPIVAAMLNLINEERLAAGKPTVGFVNPVLYQHPEMFNDILVGSQPLGGNTNDGCGTNEGFLCQPGWDPVTGLGTPKFKKMLEVFMSV
ncbi:peptidase S8/S53, subtilisin/kexin/sedolisin [Purpureocillium lavendulum]|uniref:Peptidase S8/S53, subtilisin/kexin/sedolisin n=1 Tax=Purpureocillium lavendulum TaxID=1247861 RepID=A0AB34G4M4_9HYPO|nr:peptidase S8/S53, subtilisin/kexin/sedolisin [Purpureocillium lavendulum]